MTQQARGSSPRRAVNTPSRAWNTRLTRGLGARADALDQISAASDLCRILVGFCLNKMSAFTEYGMSDRETGATSSAPEFMNVSQMHAALGLSRDRLHELTRENVFPPPVYSIQS